MIIDFHTHIFPPDIRAARRDHFPGEPEFDLLYRSPRAKLVGAAELIATMDCQGVDKAVVFGFPWRSADTFRRHNDYIGTAVRRFPDRLIGFGCFEPCHPRAATEARRCIDSGLSGIGELAFYQCGIDTAALDHLAPVMRLCRENHLPVLIHTNEPVGHIYPGKSPHTLLQIYELIRRFPDNTIVLGHWGGGIFFYGLLKKEVTEALKNVYYDTAASPYLYDTRIYTVAAQLAGPDKILFGSDYPLLPPARYREEFFQAGLSPADIDRISGGNAAHLLGL
ncbi:MAG: amidohydrolase family protein [Desulfobacterales bacterium]